MNLPSIPRTALAAAALACGAGLAQATAITFDAPALDTSLAPLAPYLLTDRDVLLQNGMGVQLFNINNPENASDGSLTGALIDGADSSCDPSLICPRSTSTYLATVNDGIVALFNASSPLGFRLNGFSAAFIGTPGNTLSQASGFYAGLIRLYAVRTDGSQGYLSTNFWLQGTDPQDQLAFETFTLSEQDRNTDFLEIDFVGFGCDAATCTPFSTNRAQFALDDIDARALPEPGAALLLGAAGLAAFGAARRGTRKA